LAIEVIRTTVIWIDTLDLTYYTVADGDGQPTTACEAGLDVGGRSGRHRRSVLQILPLASFEGSIDHREHQRAKDGVHFGCWRTE
jgi:hypothetical protein